MSTTETPDLAGDLYALVVYLHAGSNRDLFQAFTEEELSISQVQLLDRLRSGRSRPTLRQASRILNLSHAATSRLVDQLCRRGLVRREDDEDDMRAKRLVITDRGDAVIARLHAARLDQIRDFTEELDAEQRAKLHAGLRPVAARADVAIFRPLPVPA